MTMVIPGHDDGVIRMCERIFQDQEQIKKTNDKFTEFVPTGQLTSRTVWTH